MKIGQSFFLTLAKSVLTNTLIIIAFSGLFSSSLKLDSAIYGFYGALIITLLYTFVRPLIMLFGIFAQILTLGLFGIVVNALLLLLVSSVLAPHFTISSFMSACVLAIFISVINLLLSPPNVKVIRFK